jgi:hypothetical protein
MVEVPGVTAPATIEVTLPKAVALRGAIGFAAGTRCPFRRVHLLDEDGDETSSADVDAHCHFELGEVAPGSEVHLRATAPGWIVDERLTVPAQGDPPPVCLNPPCRELPPIAPTSLEVILTGAPPRSSISVEVTQTDDDDTGASGCASSGNQCEARDLQPDRPTTVTVTEQLCAAVRREVILHPGTNTLTVPCQRLRLVEGLAHGGRRPATISCPGGGETDLAETSVFDLHCPADGTELRYRAAGGPWRTAPLQAGADPTFVELAL